MPPVPVLPSFAFTVRPVCGVEGRPSRTEYLVGIWSWYGVRALEPVILLSVFIFVNTPAFLTFFPYTFQKHAMAETPAYVQVNNADNRPYRPFLRIANRLIQAVISQNLRHDLRRIVGIPHKGRDCAGDDTASRFNVLQGPQVAE